MKGSTMIFFALTLVVGAACAKEDPATQPPAAAPPGYGQPAYGQPQAAAPGAYGQPGYAAPQQGYGQPGMAPAPAPMGAPAAPMGAPATAGPALATPGPLALPCSSDAQCGLAHCNTQYGKCAFPCLAATDCIQGNSCNTMTGFCLPGGG